MPKKPVFSKEEYFKQLDTFLTMPAPKANTSLVFGLKQAIQRRKTLIPKI